MCTEGDIRLVGGENQYEGTVEICYNGLWGMISDFNWGSSDARVACQQLKLPTDGKKLYLNASLALLSCWSLSPFSVHYTTLYHYN